MLPVNRPARLRLAPAAKVWPDSDDQKGMTLDTPIKGGTVDRPPPPPNRPAVCEAGVCEKLRPLVRSFDPENGAGRRLIRELADRDWQPFYDAVIEILKAGDGSRGCRYLVSLLAGRGRLIDALCDSAFTRDQVLALARTAMQVDPMMVTHLAKAMADGDLLGREKRTKEVIRLMGIVEEISGHGGIPPTFRHMIRHPNPHLRSKAVLMIGRHEAASRWLHKCLAEQDPRTRANAVEALWGADSYEARAVLRAAARDPNNRVVGNGLLALYLLGDCSVVKELLRMAGDESVVFRSTAAWAMGNTVDTRFVEALSRMLGDASAAVRARAFAAMAQIRAAAEAARRGSQWLVAAGTMDAPDGRRRIGVEIASPGGERPLVLPTQIILSEDGRNVIDYQVDKRTPADTLGIVFVLPEAPGPGPAPWNRGALRSLAWKRPSDKWCVVPYLTGDGTGGVRIRLSDTETRFTSDPSKARELFDDARERTYYPDVWRALARALLPRFGPPHAARRLIVVNTREAGASAESHDMAAAAAAIGASIQAISYVENPFLDGLCRSTQGDFQLARNDDEAAALVERASVNLLARYVATYEPVCAAAKSVKVRVHAPHAWGETQLSIAQ